MENAPNVGQVQQLAALFQQYGASVFSFLFLLLLPATLLALEKKFDEPVSGKPGRRPFRTLAVASVVFGALLAIVAIATWRVPPSHHVYKAKIRDLQPYEHVDSDGMYFRAEFRAPMADEPPRNVHFVAVGMHPFEPGQTIPFDFRKEGGKRERLRMPYTSDRDAEFVIVWDEKEGRTVVRRYSDVQSSRARSGGWLVRRAYASEPPPAIDRARDLPPSPSLPPPNPSFRLNSRTVDLMSALQDPRSGVGRKIAALDQLLKYDRTGIEALVHATTLREPAAVTLIDLTRHSDRELASKARAFVGRFDLEALVVEQLGAVDPAARAMGEATLMRLDTTSAQRVLARVSPGTRTRLSSKSAENAGGLPIPTGSRMGDRYYVSATWNPKDAPVVQCLTTTFHRALVTDRALAEEAALMRRRKDRLVYGYSADWAKEMARQIRHCGAHASFVRPWASSMN